MTNHVSQLCFWGKGVVSTPPGVLVFDYLVHQPKAFSSDSYFCEPLSQCTDHQQRGSMFPSPPSSRPGGLLRFLFLLATKTSRPPARPPTKRQYVSFPRQQASIQPASSQQRQSVGQAARQPASQPATQPVSQPANQPVSQLAFDYLVHQPKAFSSGSHFCKPLNQ